MTTLFVGTTFPSYSDWHTDETDLIDSIRRQIDTTFPTGQNLLINSTWFGPQFDNGQWLHYKQLISSHQFDRLFVIAAADPVFLNHDQLAGIQQETHSDLYLLGHFDTRYYFNFHSQVLLKYFKVPPHDQTIMKSSKYLYVNYNRKPRDHRNALANLLYQTGLTDFGILTMGKSHPIYSKERQPIQHLTLGEKENEVVGNWEGGQEFGIQQDLHSLGRLDIWQNHFLNIISETEFWPWDNMFISEKTWKPILGLRPFVINGQQKIYQYLRQQGFCTFNHYWSDIDIESGDVHASIVQLVNHLTRLSSSQLSDMYHDMLPALIHNRSHFYDYAAQQKHKIQNIFLA